MEDFENFQTWLKTQSVERKKEYTKKPAAIKATEKKTKGGYKVNRNGKPIRKN